MNIVLLLLLLLNISNLLISILVLSLLLLLLSLSSLLPGWATGIFFLSAVFGINIAVILPWSGQSGPTKSKILQILFAGNLWATHSKSSDMFQAMPNGSLIERGCNSNCNHCKYYKLAVMIIEKRVWIIISKGGLWRVDAILGTHLLGTRLAVPQCRSTVVFARACAKQGGVNVIVLIFVVVFIVLRPIVVIGVIAVEDVVGVGLRSVVNVVVVLVVAYIVAGVLGPLAPRGRISRPCNSSAGGGSWRLGAVQETQTQIAEGEALLGTRCLSHVFVIF